MSAPTGIVKTSIARKFVMAFTGFFLIVFLLTHLSINLLTLSSDPEAFNEASHFMATNPLIQVMQYVLAAGFLIHIIMGIKLTKQNSDARPVKYVKNNAAANSGFASRSMIVTGLLVLVFIVLHLKDYFWVLKFGDMTPYSSDYDLVVGLFSSPLYTVIYVAAFVLLGIHLSHGFQSAFQSLGANHPQYTPFVKGFGTWYSILVPAGFALVAVWHFVQSL